MCSPDRDALRRNFILLIPYALVLSLVLVSIADAADTNLVGRWKLDGNATDSSGNNHPGTLFGNPRWVAGKIGGALELDGDGDYVDVGRVGISGAAPRTLTGWAKASTTAIPSWTTVFGFAQKGSGDGTYFDIEVDDGGNYVIHVYGWEAVICAVDTQWHHLAATYDGSGGRWYLDGRMVGSEAGAIATVDEVRIGARLSNTNYFPGLVDDVRIYNKALTTAEIKKLVAGSRAYDPSPADGALYEDTWVSLGWMPGDTAVSHDVYFGDNFDDVNKGAGETFQGNQTTMYFVAGFPGSPYPDGLVPGTTYYWRIDEVEADGTTIHKGDIWSFMVPSKAAYNPKPADGAKFIDTNVVLIWTAGFDAKLHTVYFGDNFDDVNNAAGGLPQSLATYTPGPLELDKTYYWRVDEFDAVNTYKGDVWSFSTAGAGGGVRGDYYKGMDLRKLVLTRIDPQINFNWGGGAPDEAVGAEQFSVRWTGEVESVFTETYTFYTNSDDGIRLWVDGQQLVDNWTDHGATEDSGRIGLVAGQTYSIVMEMYENGGSAVAELRWESPRTPKQLIPQAALSLPVRASRSKPSNGAVDVKQTQILSWSPGDYAASHQVYFGTDEEAVKNANTGSPEYKGSRNPGSESYDPGKLQWDTTYYWRVDEVNNVNPDSPWAGNLWSFTTADFLVVDDFEDYDTGENQIWYAWKDGLGYGTPGTQLYFAGNGTGSAVGDDDTASYTEETIVHGGSQAMPFFYDNSILRYSEAEMTLTYPRDWTERGVTTLTIWFRGNSDNAAEPMYVALNGSAVVYHDNPSAAQIGTWTKWNIDLRAFADQGVNLANVNRIALGLGNKKSPVAGGSGTMYFDDIGLYPPPPEPAL